jgi:hypothetical protein
MPAISNVFDATVTQQKERHANPEKYRGWSWCVVDLNNILGRIQEGWDVRFAGPAKIGKTSFMISQAVLSMREGARIFYLGNEETEDQIMLRMITNVAEVERNKFRDLAMADADWKRVDEAGGQFHSFKGNVDYGILRLSELRKEIAKIPDLDMVFLDGQGQMEPESRFESMAQAQGEISRGIKLLTLPAKNMTTDGPQRKKSLAVFTAVHLNEEGKSLWTRGVGRDADVYLKLVGVVDATGNPVPNKLWVEVELSRHGGAGNKVKVYLNGARSLLGALDEPTRDINEYARALLTQPKDGPEDEPERVQRSPEDRKRKPAGPPGMQAFPEISGG